ncbi:MAG: hypothetical protein ACLR5H_09855 [Oscillospiraceae bacterium]
MLTTAFTVAAFLNAESPTMLMNAMFALARYRLGHHQRQLLPHGGGDVLRRRRGQIRRFYYTASMAAQVAAPMLSGLLMDRFGMHVLFPYAAVFTALAFASPCCSSATATASPRPSGAWRPWTKWRTDAGWLLLSFCWCC